MTSQAIAEGLIAWARDVLSELETGYVYVTGTKIGKLPDVMADLEQLEVVRDHPDFPMHNLQQRMIQRTPARMSFMVDNSDQEAAAVLLRDFADRLLDSAKSDGTLAGRVPFVSPFLRFDFTPPFVVYEDGTKGREMQLQITVGDLVEVDE